MEEKQPAEEQKRAAEQVQSFSLENRKSILADMDVDETPIMIHEQLEEAKKVAKKTGQRVIKRFNKRAFIKQFPQAGNDPRMALTPDVFKLEVAPMATLTVGELRDMCVKIPGHPLALQKALQVEGLADGTVIHILKEEYIILKNAAK